MPTTRARPKNSTLALSPLKVDVNVTQPSVGPTETEYHYIDPGLSDVPAGEARRFTIENARQGSRIRVNWGVAGGDADWRIRLHPGIDTSTPHIAERSDSRGPGALLATFLADGAYTVEFVNNSTEQIVSGAFNSSGGTNKTWVYVQAFQDYVVSATAAGATVKAFLRQVPDPTDPSRYRVYTESWRPYD